MIFFNQQLIIQSFVSSTQADLMLHWEILSEQNLLLTELLVIKFQKLITLQNPPVLYTHSLVKS